MKYKTGDKVRIKSLDWYNENKRHLTESVELINSPNFIKEMSCFCNKIMTIVAIKENVYLMEEDDSRFDWTDEMIEGLVEEETTNVMNEDKMLIGWVKESNRYRLVPDKDYEIKYDEKGFFYLEKKKKEYPKTYEECGLITDAEDRIPLRIIGAFTRLINARNAYWKIAGEEMGLGKPWEPDWENSEEKRYCIVNIEGNINLPEKILTKWILKVTNKILVFPTEEMRDAFYENFKDLIEQCKELL